MFKKLIKFLFWTESDPRWSGTYACIANFAGNRGVIYATWDSSLGVWTYPDPFWCSDCEITLRFRIPLFGVKYNQ